MKSADVHLAMLHAGNSAILTHDPLLDLAPLQIFDICAALRREVDALEAEGVRLLTASKAAKGVSA